MKFSSRSWGEQVKPRRLLLWCALSILLSVSSGVARAQPVISRQGSIYVADIGGHHVSFVLSDAPGRAVHIEARCVIQAPQAHVWRVLTDYDHLEEFVPFLTKSRVLERAGDRLTLRQEGRASLFIFRHPFTVTFQIHEQPIREIRFQAVAGDFRRFDGAWLLEAQSGGTLVRHQVEVEPAFYTPRWVMRILERRIMLKSIEAVIHRCETR